MIKNETVQKLSTSDWQGKNSLPWSDELGGIPLVYVTSFGQTKCDECANELADCEIEDVTEVIPYYEGNTIQCDECGREIESAYGDPEEYGQD